MTDAVDMTVEDRVTLPGDNYRRNYSRESNSRTSNPPRDNYRRNYTRKSNSPRESNSRTSNSLSVLPSRPPPPPPR